MHEFGVWGSVGKAKGEKGEGEGGMPANMMGCLASARPVALASRAVIVTPLGLSRRYRASSLSVVML